PNSPQRCGPTWSVPPRPPPPPKNSMSTSTRCGTVFPVRANCSEWTSVSSPTRSTSTSPCVANRIDRPTRPRAPLLSHPDPRTVAPGGSQHSLGDPNGAQPVRDGRQTVRGLVAAHRGVG